MGDQETTNAPDRSSIDASVATPSSSQEITTGIASIHDQEELLESYSDIAENLASGITNTAREDMMGDLSNIQETLAKSVLHDFQSISQSLQEQHQEMIRSITRTMALTTKPDLSTLATELSVQNIQPEDVLSDFHYELTTPDYYAAPTKITLSESVSTSHAADNLIDDQSSRSPHQTSSDSDTSSVQSETLGEPGDRGSMSWEQYIQIRDEIATRLDSRGADAIATIAILTVLHWGITSWSIPETMSMAYILAQVLLSGGRMVFPSD